MSVIQVQQQQKKSNGILSGLGMLATLGGTLTGQPWLSALGMAAHGANAMMNGNDTSMDTAEKTSGALNEVLTGLKSVWSKPTDNNPAKSEAKNAADKINKTLGTNSGTPIADVANSIGQDYSPLWRNVGNFATGPHMVDEYGRPIGYGWPTVYGLGLR